MKLLELGTKVVDSASATNGMLTHAQIGGDDAIAYLFQPEGINPETGQPVKEQWIVGSTRIKYGKIIDVDMPLDIMGKQVTDKASGFKGEIIHLTLHISGCVHALVQAKGIVKKTGALIEPVDFDIRRLSGKCLPALNETEKKKDIKKKPSPASMPSLTPYG